MHTYDRVDEAFINAPPDVVWEALVAELNGSARWWVPHNTFAPGETPPEQVGGAVHVTVHTKGVDKGGPKLRFAGLTRTVEHGRRLSLDYVEGHFVGSGEFALHAVDEGRRTLLAMRFQASPQGFARLVARFADLGVKHSQATQAAFATLNSLVSTGPAGRAG